MSRFKINKVKLDLTSYPFYIIMGQPKVGKTTLFDRIVKLYTGGPEGGLLISVGKEGGYHAIDNIQVEEAPVWYKDPLDENDSRGFVQIVDDLVENKDKYGIKLVGVDTLDELYNIATEQVFLEHRQLKGSFPKSLNDALGGFGAGRARLTQIVVEQLTRLNRAGYAVFILAHTKNKELKDELTGEPYEVITNNLNRDYFNAVANLAQMVVNIIIERDIDKEGRVIGTKRMMYFRSNGLVDAGGRFEGLPEKLELSAENFMKAFEIGVQNSIKVHKPRSQDEIEKIKEQERKELEEKRQKLLKEEEVSSSERKDNLIKEVVELIKLKATTSEELKNKITDKVKQLGLDIKTLGKSLDGAPLSTLKELSIFLKSL